MSLVVAFAGKKRAILGGDKRSIAFFGKADSLEEELYSGQIQTDEDLARRAEELGAQIAISDGREKVWRRGDVLVGEVTELSFESQRHRRIYTTPGAYLIVDVEGKEVAVIKKGKSTLIILGNRFTQKLARDMLATGKAPDPSAIESVLQEARRRSASVSSEHAILVAEKVLSNPEAALFQALRQDCEEMGWKISGPR